MSDVPTGWTAVELRELVTLKTGPFGSSLHESDYVASGIPIINPMHIDDGRICASSKHRVSVETAERLGDFKVRLNDIVIGRRGEMGRCAVVRSHEAGWLCGTGSLIVRAAAGLSADFLQRYLSSDSVVKYLIQASVGSTMANLNQEVLMAVAVALPPSHEQTRIVDKLEELLSDLDAGVAELKAAQRKLAQYRQSLLKAAVEGRLTEAWRAQHSEPDESGAQLLARILRERRARWEAGHRAKFHAQGKGPGQGWKDDYLEPLSASGAGPFELPAGWVWTTADALIANIETGKSFKCEERPPRTGEVGVAKVSAVSWGEYDEEESKTCVEAGKMNASLFVQVGDFLFSRANTIELVGACVIARNVSMPVMLSDKTLRFTLALDKLKPWLLTILRSKFGRTQIELLSSGNQESMRNIGQQRIRQIAVPLPPAGELKEILARLAAAIEEERSQQAAIQRALRQSAAQRKNILQAAFSGQLVRQEPNDEPASVLLERIRAERAGRVDAKRGRKRVVVT